MTRIDGRTERGSGARQGQRELGGVDRGRERRRLDLGAGRRDGLARRPAVPGDRLVMNTVRVPTGMTDLAYGAGALWAREPAARDAHPGRRRARLGRPHDPRRRLPARGRGGRGGRVGRDGARARATLHRPSQATAGVTPLPASFCERPFYGGASPRTGSSSPTCRCRVGCGSRRSRWRTRWRSSCASAASAPGAGGSPTSPATTPWRRRVCPTRRSAPPTHARMAAPAT